MVTRAKAVKNVVAKGKKDLMCDIDVLKDMLENAPLNVMIADHNEEIVFVNRRARETLQAIEGDLAKYLPGFRADQVAGGSIHRYHKDPAAIKNILRGLQPGGMRQGFITPGHFFLEHETRVLVNGSGDRVGYIVQWADVTEKRAKEEQANRLQLAIDGAQTAMMTIDRNLVITYANKETKRLLTTHEAVLCQLYPGFSVDKLVGTCIDIFHKNPAHQRRMLENPQNLPHEADIHVGPLTFHIRASAIHDLAGNYTGTTLEWLDVTELRQKEAKNADYAGQIAAIGKAQAVIEFNMDGTVIGANENFLNTLGYSLKEIQGQHHSMFVEPGYRQSIEYRAFWEKLSRGEYDAGQYKRIGKGGKEVWIQASYNPIFDLNGKPFKVVKYATDISQQKDAEHQMQVLINSALAGKLDERIDVSGYEGSIRQSAENINKLMDAIVSPIRESTRVLGLLAQGDLTNHMDGNYQGEFSSLRDSINTSIENLFKMVADIRETTTNISSAATEIAQGNSDLSQRTEEQASSLEETASSMEELTSTVKQNADNARQANQLAASARDQAEKGGEVVGSAISAMAAINSSSKKISDIIGVIDEIAFQTNLLALNAAVEAARAGEQGRGFAVVAAEVRNLAQRSATAAKEIKSLIKDSVEKVDEGSRLVDASGKTLAEIVGSVKKVSDIIAEIAAASQEQSAGIDQVNKAVMQMDEVTQQNAALVEEAAAASEAMDEQAQGLKKLIAFFKVDEQEMDGSRMDAFSGGRASARSSEGKGSSSRKAPTASRGGGGFSSPKAPAAALKGNARPKTMATSSMDDAEWEEF